MSFPYHDHYWCEVADFIDTHGRKDDRILANDIFWWRFDEIFRYANLHLEPSAIYDWVVVHKGELSRFPAEFLKKLPDEYVPVLANPVFVLWSNDRQLMALTQHPDLVSFASMLADRAAKDFEPQPADDFVFPTPGRIGKLERLDKNGLAAAMDRFFEAGGYLYETLRDKSFYAEIDRWIRVFWQGLDEAEVLDVACGNGRVARTVDKYRSMLEVDLSPVAVTLARKAGAGDTRRRAEVMDAEALTLPDDQFDVVTFIEAVEHVHDLGAALHEAARVLRRGGVFIANSANADSLHQRLNRKLGYPYFKTNFQHIREFSWTEFRTMLETAGFEIERAEGIFLYPYWGIPGIDQYVRPLTDNDPEVVEALRYLGERAGPEFAYCDIVRARKR